MFQNFETTSDSTASAGRIADLRAQLAEAGVDGFLVPRSDAHMGEMVAARDERLAWLTGFTGSAGIAIVLGARAALFADGRYTLQAAGQTDPAVVEVVAITATPPETWLADAVAEGQRIGFDPWLHAKAEIDRFAEALAPKGASLVPLPANPLDAIWQDQPPAPTGSVRIHPEDLAGEPAADKRARMGTAVAEAGADRAVLTLPDSIAWLLNIRGSDLARSPVAHGFALLDRAGEVTLFMDPDKLDGAVRTHLGNGVEVVDPAELPARIAGIAGRVLLDRRSCPVWFADAVEAAGATVDWGQDPCIAAKAVKTVAELDGMRAAHLRDGAVMVRFLHWLDTALAAGETLDEIAIVRRLEALRVETGTLYDISFDTICGTGPNGAIVHYRVNRDSNRVLQPGELLLVDSGGQYDDGTTDITRTVATGPAGAAERRHFTLVLKGMIAISRIRFPHGIRGRDLDALARAALWRAGLDYDHGTGHGVGACLNVHEGPQNLSRRGEAVLEPGMILSNEPGVYFEGRYGIRIENLVIVTPPEVPPGGDRAMQGFETLTWCPIDRRLIDAGLLDAEERAWLDAYHAEVRDRLTPLLDEAAAAWLAGATQPLD